MDTPQVEVLAVSYRLSTCLTAMAALIFPANLLALSLSGILLFSADDFGNPSGWDEQAETFVHRQVWVTRRLGNIHSLAVLNGLPPDSLAGGVLNAPDFTVEIPLVEGENNFTIVGGPSPSTAGDPYDGFVLNLYFDSILDQPGLTVVFPREAALGGSPPSPNRSGLIYDFNLELAEQGTARAVYEDAGLHVTVAVAAFLPSAAFEEVDRIGPYALGPDGQPDWVGIIKILVEVPTDDAPLTGGRYGGEQGAPVLVAPILTVRVGPDLHALAPGAAASDVPPPAQTSQAPVAAESSPTGALTPTVQPTTKSPSPGPRSTATPARTGSATPCETGSPTPRASAENGVGAASPTAFREPTQRPLGR